MREDWQRLQQLERELSRIAVREIPDGVSGTLILDDGANWRLTLVFMRGACTSIVTAASAGAAATWTPA